jgi:hypothetical protein
MFDDMEPIDETWTQDIDIISDKNGKKTVVRVPPQHINYIFRGPDLAKYSPLEYAVCVTIDKKRKKRNNIHGRRPRPSFDFDPGHPLFDKGYAVESILDWLRDRKIQIELAS